MEKGPPKFTMEDIKKGTRIVRVSDQARGHIKDISPAITSQDRDYIGIQWDNGGYTMTPHFDEYDLEAEFDRLVEEGDNTPSPTTTESSPPCKGKVWGHTWVTYTGLREVWEYCEKCDVKRDEVDIGVKWSEL